MTTGEKLGLSVRYYLFADAGRPLRMSQRLVEGLSAGTDFMPSFAGTRQRVLAAILENEDGTPKELLRAEPSIWEFDATGGITEGLRARISEVIDLLPGSPETPQGNVVPISPKLKRKRFAERHGWEPRPSDLELVRADIWSKGPDDRLEQAQGTNKRPPAITYEARRALEEASEPFWKIDYAVRKLGDKSLAGLAFQARQKATENDLGPLYKAVADIADARLAILRRRRSGQGVWYAVVEVLRWDYAHQSAEVIATYHRRCKDRKRAALAARELLKAQADSLDHDVTLETSVETDLEWEEAARLSTEA